MAGKKLSVQKKRDIIIGLILALCLVLGVIMFILVQNAVGTPVYYDGDMKNVCIRITEICAKNQSIIVDANGEYSDYIELYNYGDTISLAGFGLANDSSNSVKYKFKNLTINAGEYAVIFLDGIEIPFRLASSGNEYISLVAFDGTVISSVTTSSSGADEVIIWSEAGYIVSSSPSPGFPNTEEGAKQFREGVFETSPLLVINEIIIDNDSALPDFEGDYDDIIEIMNISGSDVSTSGYFISDSADDRLRCALPDKTLAPGECLLVFASGKDMTAESGEFHADFRLSDGETVYLTKDGRYVSADALHRGTNLSTARIINDNGTAEYTVMAASLGFSNNDSGVEALAEIRIDRNLPLVISELLLADDGTPYRGKLRDVVEITNISTENVSTKGYYLSDSERDPYKFAIPETDLAPGQCIVIYCDDSMEELSAGFSLADDEAVYLTAPNFKHGDAVNCVKAGRGSSLSLDKITDEGAVYRGSAISIGHANDDNGVAAYEKESRPETVEFSEAVSVNTKYLAGPYGTYHDFIELHNNTDSAIDLTGWYLSDNAKKLRKASLDGMKISAGGYLVIICSSDGVNTPKGYNVAGFSLSVGGETVYLSHGDEIVDSMAIPALGENAAYGRAEGYDGFSLISSPTPGVSNGRRIDSPTASPVSSVPQGVYNDISSLTVELSGEGDIYYTTDCSDPTVNGKLYTTPLTLSNTTVIRCCAAAEGKTMSEVNDLTYIINENNKLETISLVTEPENLWDYYTGIYVKGPNASSTFPYEGANYFKDWERAATLAFFPSDGDGFYIGCGIKMFGGYSRALDKKSFSCFFRGKYGDGSLDYSLFGDDGLNSFESIVLRNTGQDATKSNMRDAMITQIVADMTDVDVQAQRPVVLYLNGEFWGVYFIREKVNRNYVAGHQNVTEDQAQVDYASGTRTPDYTAIINYVKSHDMTNSDNYNYVASQVDIDEYIDYIIAEICIANTDNGNIKFGKAEGGKWRWIMYDVDQSFRDPANKTLSAHLNPSGTGSGNRFPTTLINALLKNSSFKDKFLRRFAWQLNNIWTPEHVLPYIDAFSDMIASDMVRDCEKYGKSYSEWKSHVESLRTFINSRAENLKSQAQAYFSLTDSDMVKYGFYA